MNLQLCLDSQNNNMFSIYHGAEIDIFSLNKTEQNIYYLFKEVSVRHELSKQKKNPSTINCKKVHLRVLNN